ncbi:MAG: ArsA family ATPase [Spirochaetales bacterium]|nr:ArsA family ATPase [Spirochaetales bacterium]
MKGKILVFTGKGGVGKTSVAAAHALKAARNGLKTLLVSTDMAHNLSDLFDRRIGREPVEISDMLFALEIDPNYEMQNRYGKIKDAVLRMMNLEKETEESFEDIIVFPGMEEIFSLIRIKEIFEQDIYDRIIMDCAPTGETLSLLKFPELLSWYMERFLPIGKKILKVIRPVSKALFKIELPDNETVSDVEKLFITLNELQNLLKSRDLTSIRIVTIPEKMVIEETKRSYMYLCLYDFNVDGIYINRVLSDEVKNPFFSKWKQKQKEYLDEIDSAFYEIPKYTVKWYRTDINGFDGLSTVIADSFSSDEILEIRPIKSNQQFSKTDDGYCLTIPVPFSSKEDFGLFESGSEIIVRTDNFKRSIPYPDTLRGYSIAAAQYVDNCLHISFVKPLDAEVQNDKGA